MVVPIHKRATAISAVCRSIYTSKVPVEVIYVISKGLEGDIKPKGPMERVLVNELTGRGYPMMKGVEESKGDIIVILHSDTLLPAGWDAAIISALRDKSVIGGGFSYSFDMRKDISLILAFEADVMTFIFGDLWGDRALFARAGSMKECVGALDTPFFEDARLSHQLKNRGRVVILKQRVTTSGEKFRRRNPLLQSLRIFNCRMMLEFGVDPWKIYHYYYS